MNVQYIARSSEKAQEPPTVDFGMFLSDRVTDSRMPTPSKKLICITVRIFIF